MDQCPEWGNVTSETETHTQTSVKTTRGQTSHHTHRNQDLKENNTPLFLFLHVGTHCSEGRKIKLSDVWKNEQRTC